MSLPFHYAGCHYAGCHYAGCHYAGCHYAGCHYAGCHYAKCRGADWVLKNYSYFHNTVLMEQRTLKF
jgi:hypothetical protein